MKNNIIQRSLPECLYILMFNCLNFVWLVKKTLNILWSWNRMEVFMCGVTALSYSIEENYVRNYLDTITSNAHVLVLMNSLFPLHPVLAVILCYSTKSVFSFNFLQAFSFGSFIFPYPLKPSIVIQFTAARPFDRARNNQFQALLIQKLANNELMILIILCFLG